MEPPIIEVNGLTKIFGDTEPGFTAIDNISFKVHEGEVLGICGSSGGGKTTLLGLIGGLDRPTKGSIKVLGERLQDLDDKRLSDLRLRKIGFIFQEHNLIPALSVEENLLLPLTLAKVPRVEAEKRVKTLLDIVELSHLRERYPSQLSRGQRQRIAAVRALANNPTIILADEPTSDLDPVNAKILLDFLSKLNREKGTTIVIGATNVLDFQEITDRELRIIEGKIVL